MTHRVKLTENGKTGVMMIVTAIIAVIIIVAWFKFYVGPNDRMLQRTYGNHVYHQNWSFPGTNISDVGAVSYFDVLSYRICMIETKRSKVCEVIECYL